MKLNLRLLTALIVVMSIFTQCSTKEEIQLAKPSEKQLRFARITSYNVCYTKLLRFQPNWESLAKHKAAPEWFQDAKLGIYFHWGPYSVPAFKSEWYPRMMFEKGSQA